MSKVWLAEKTSLDRAIFGVFSTPEKARDVCWDDASGYFGREQTHLLKWLGDDGFASASHYDPGSLNVHYMVTRYEIDEVTQ